MDQSELANKRLLAPDLARGFMLLLIALAHAPMYVQSSGSGILSHPTGGSILDSIMKFVTIMFVDQRTYPMFAALFGFGLAMIISKRLSKGSSITETKKIVYRRCFYLILFGAVHAVFAFSYDILSIYGTAGLIVGWLMFRSDRVLLRGIAWLTGIVLFFLVYQAILMFFGIIQTNNPHGSMETELYGASMLLRLTEFPVWIIYSLLAMPLLVPLLLGVWAKRKEFLDKPQQNKSLLKKVTIIGISISVIGALPIALAGAELWQPSSNIKGVLMFLHTTSGMFGGIGYTAMFGLISLNLANRSNFIIESMVAIGRRSLTCYLAQSIALAVFLSDWGFGLGNTIHSLGAALFAFFIWLMTVVLAVILERKGSRGPAGALLQRLIYKK